MRALCAAHIPILLVIIAFAAASPTALRGVDPALQHHYQSGGTTFACIDGTKTIPRGHVNDGYCDCYDGTDEPGTAACGNGKFYCRNLGSESLQLNASFVDDDVCDCCDGSDEPLGKCANTCIQAASAAIASLKQDLALAETGLRMRSKYVKEAAEARTTWTSRLVAIANAEGPTSRKAQSTKAESDKLAAQLQQLRARKRMVETTLNPPSPPPPSPEQQELEKPTSPPAAAHATEDHSVASTDEELVEVDSVEAVGGTGERQGESTAEDQNTEASPEEIAKRVASQWIPTEKQEEENDGEIDEEYPDAPLAGDESLDEEEVLESEDVESEVLDAEDVESEEIPPHTPETADSDAFAPEVDLRQIDLGHVGALKAWLAGLFARLRGTAALEHELQQLTAAIEVLKRRVEASSTAAAKAATAEEKLREEKADLEGKIAGTYGPEDAYAPLLERCIEATVEKYIYRVCPFQNAEQVDSGRATSLGTWGSFGESGDVMKFQHGETCWQGPPRTMTVMLRCGATDRLSKVAEPSRCEYTAELETPAACGEIAVQKLRQALLAKEELLKMATKKAAANFSSKDEL